MKTLITVSYTNRFNREEVSYFAFYNDARRYAEAMSREHFSATLKGNGYQQNFFDGQGGSTQTF